MPSESSLTFTPGNSSLLVGILSFPIAALVLLLLLIAPAQADRSPEAGAGPKKLKNSVVCPQQFTTLGDCPKEGCGGDPKLNEQKNRTDKAQDSPSIEEWTVKEILDMEGPDGWHTGEDRGPLRDLGEGSPLFVKGFLVNAEVTGTPEACNCYLPEDKENDFHLNLVGTKPSPVTAATRKKAKADSVVVEMSPRARPDTWTLGKLKPLAARAAYVRTTGWLMYDTMHTGNELQGRGTSWEVHPVTEFEICTTTKLACDQGNGWKKLAN